MFDTRYRTLRLWLGIAVVLIALYGLASGKNIGMGLLLLALGVFNLWLGLKKPKN
ncbi:membrane-bound ClpP family serine protease [Deinobacterium chartae]|uniref:Membrane-bound ClpP family serine protease n=1 Tax=Deinobacterium chartae TaxID=521158 RepID=A0A841HXJ2_9DEIO|nr:hypothetical protein [Deinobacterium chartae]MBB6096920.1 membrane-bound ClpP family serine protease [Deinobacterium chartae]